MRIFYLFSLLILIHCNLEAQTGSKNYVKVGAGIYAAVPLYNLDMSATGAGGDIMLQYVVSDKVWLTADGGFAGLPGKKNYPATAIIPIRVGARYFPLTKVYVGVKAGLGIYTILKASANHTAYAAGAGYFLTDRLEAGISYDGYTNRNSSFGYGSVRLAYNFINR